MDGTQVVERQLAAMAQGPGGGRRAQMARVAWQLITREGGPECFTQLRVQEFCWDRLPTEVEGTAAERKRLAEALATLLDRLGLRRYGEIARGPATHQVIDAADAGPQALRAARERAWGRSGILPATTMLLTWGSDPGPGERFTYEHAAGALETAVVTGDVRPGRPRWRDAALEITGKVLTTQRDNLGGKAALPGILEERFHRWASRSTPRRRELFGSLGAQITSGRSAGGDAAQTQVAALTRLGWLLSRARDGVALTDLGYVVPSVVREYCTVCDERELELGRGNREVNVPSLQGVRALTRRAGLTRRRGNLLVTTSLGTTATQSPEALRAVFADTWVGREPGVMPVVRELMAGLLLAGAPASLEEVSDDVASLLVGSGWSLTDGAALDADAAFALLLEPYRELVHLELLHTGLDGLQLTAGARPLLLACLRQRLAHLDLPSSRVPQ